MIQANLKKAKFILRMVIILVVVLELMITKKIGKKLPNQLHVRKMDAKISN